MSLGKTDIFNYDTNEYVCPGCGRDVADGKAVALAVVDAHDHLDMASDVRYHRRCFTFCYDARLPKDDE